MSSYGILLFFRFTYNKNNHIITWWNRDMNEGVFAADPLDDQDFHFTRFFKNNFTNFYHYIDKFVTDRTIYRK